MNIQYILAPIPLTRNHISCSENALKRNYSNVECRTPRHPASRGGEGRRGKRRRGKGVGMGEVAPWASGGWTPLAP